MSQPNTVYQIRMGQQEKQEMIDFFASIGMKPSQAFRMLYNEAKHLGRMPFTPSVPNKKTAEFLSLPNEKKGYQKVNQASDLLLDLDD